MNHVHAAIMWMLWQVPTDHIEFVYMGAIAVMMACIGIAHFFDTRSKTTTATPLPLREETPSDESMRKEQLREPQRRSTRIAAAAERSTVGARRKRANSSN